MSFQHVSQRIKSSLDSAGVVGFFGGDAATLALLRRAVYEGAPISGWYNSAGSFDLAKRLSRLIKSRFGDTVFPGPNLDPVAVFQSETPDGPGYRAAHSGTWIPRTGYVARLVEEECAQLPAEVTEGRKTTPVGVTIIDLTYAPEAVTHPRIERNGATLLALLPIAASIGTSAACFSEQDWFAGAMILLGVATSGITSAVLSSARLTFDHPTAASGAPSGDGLLMGNREVVILKGREDAVNAVTRGRFSLQYDGEAGYTLLRACSFLYSAQFLLQLLLVPQATLYGQIMFLASVAISWIYSVRISALDGGRIQRKVLLDSVLKNPGMRKYALGTRTSMAVFTLLVLKPLNLEKHLDELLPNDTRVWKIWKENVLARIQAGQNLRIRLDVASKGDLTDAEFTLLNTLYGDAEAAEVAYELERRRSETSSKLYHD